MRFHILGVPHTVTTKEFVACAYTQKVLKFGKMMRQRGHTVIHYGHKDSDLECSEHVPVTTNEDLEKAYGSYDWRKNFFKFDTTDHAYKTFYKNAIAEVGKRKKENDFILPFWGWGVKEVCDAHEHDMIVVEPGIGYAGGSWARWKIFESYAIMHAYYGMAGVGHCTSDWYDAVIPNYFDVDDFDYSEDKDDYILFLGRIYEGKGIHIAIQATQAAGKRLVVAGQNPDNISFPSHVDYVGYADAALRRKLMSKASGLIVASGYIEPFGGVQVESFLSGTPVISSDWGSFAENNLHGVTGYRCRTFDHFVWAIKNIDRIDPRNCRKWGENFSLDKIGNAYDEYFKNVLNVYKGAGWYERDYHRYDLSWLTKEYPFYGERMNFNHIEDEEKDFAKDFAVWVKEKINPKNILDVGCGPGTFVRELNNVGIDSRGVDIDSRVSKIPNLEKKSIFDLDENDTADTILFFEVAEHIEEEKSDKIVEKIVNATEKTLLWSSAGPGQIGIGHINCQPREFWVEKLTNAGLVRNLEKEKELVEWSKPYPVGWFWHNIMYFERPNLEE